MPAVVSRIIFQEVSVDKIKYMVMSRDENAGRVHSVRIDNSTFERVEGFKYLGKIYFKKPNFALRYTLKHSLIKVNELVS